jgi:hypothetical protein
MAKDPATLWYWNDWNGGTVTLTRHLKGCYIDLLHAQFNNGRLSLAQIKTVLGVDFGTAWPILQAKFKKDGNDNYYNERAEEEKNKRCKFVDSRSNNKSGRKKSYDKSHDSKMKGHMENENRNESAIVVKDGGTGEEILGPVKGVFTDLIDKQIELTDLQIGTVIEYIRLTKKRTLTVIEVKDQWEAFKINQFWKHEWYPSYEDIVSHFRNSLKKQINGTSTTQTKPGISDERTDALHNF